MKIKQTIENLKALLLSCHRKSAQLNWLDTSRHLHKFSNFGERTQVVLSVKLAPVLGEESTKLVISRVVMVVEIRRLAGEILRGNFNIL